MCTSICPCMSVLLRVRRNTFGPRARARLASMGIGEWELETKSFFHALRSLTHWKRFSLEDATWPNTNVMASLDSPPLPTSIVRGLTDKLVERRKGAALELERSAKTIYNSIHCRGNLTSYDPCVCMDCEAPFGCYIKWRDAGS